MQMWQTKPWILNLISIWTGCSIWALEKHELAFMWNKDKASSSFLKY